MNPLFAVAGDFDFVAAMRLAARRPSRLEYSCSPSRRPSQWPTVMAASAMKIFLAHPRKVPLICSHTSRKPTKTAAAPSAWQKEVCHARGQRCAIQHSKKCAQQDAESVNKCTGHPLTQTLRAPSAKQENFAPIGKAC